MKKLMRLGLFAGSCLLVFVMLVEPLIVLAQTAEPTPEPVSAIPFVHTVGDGENLTYIAGIYDVTVDDLLAINNLDPEVVLFVGQTIVIPGGQGEAVGTFYTVQVGDSLEHIAAIFNTTPEEVLETNGIENPYASFLAGERLTIVSKTGSALPQEISGRPYIVSAGDTWATISARFDLAPAELAALNERPYPSLLMPGQRLYIPSEETGYRIMSGEWLDVQLRPLPLTQGDTIVIYVENLLDGRPSGQLGDEPLHFFPVEEGYTALVGVDAFTEPGIYTLRLEGSGSRPWRPFEQPVNVQNANYGLQAITLGPEYADLLAPEVRQNEDAFLDTIFTASAEEPMWQGLFQAPVTTTFITADYGSNRTYNGGPVIAFHTGIDFGGAVGTPILAPADGIVVYSDLLELRGFSVVVDHGGGVMTAYYHLSELFVTVGDEVTQGQVLAAGGSTGLSTGPHLHWDVRVWGTAVDGTQWLQTQYP